MASQSDAYVDLKGPGDDRRTWHDLLLDCVPERNPEPWAAINFAAFVWSLVTWLTILVDGAKNDEFRSRMYLFYDFATTFIYLVEAGLTVWYLKWRAPLTQAILVVLAAYFTYVTAVTMWKKWCHPDKQVDAEEVDVLLNTAVYAWALSETGWLSWRRQTSGLPDDDLSAD
mmetsp:Transcript_31174/g.58504  ORF Transcript_31174/g.58504 Transcript_31174/m.58504 type:complete len:171 (+) Transcript_31174:35-547(+)